MLEWDKDSERLYETGVDHVALYLKDNLGKYSIGYAWNGVSSISDSPEGAEANAVYADNIKYLNLISNEDEKATITAYTSPKEFDECDGSMLIGMGIRIRQQKRRMFGLAWRSRLGNDIEGDSYGYKLHLLYGCNAAPSEKEYTTVNDSPEAAELSWEISTTPVNVPGQRPTAVVEIDSTDFDDEHKYLLAIIEGVLFGAEEFSSSKAYVAGSVVEHAGSGSSATMKLYKATSTVEAGDWDASSWTEICDAGPRLPLPEELAELAPISAT